MRLRTGATVAALVALALYANAVPNGFAVDDGPLILDNPHLEDFRLGTLFTSDYWEPVGRGGLYRPLVTSTFAAELALFGAWGPGFHLVNVLLHATVCALLVIVAWQWLGDRPVALGAGLLFAAHPVNTEAVNGLTMGIADLLAAAFGLLALVLHRRAHGLPRRRVSRWRAGALLAFALALLSKENAITFLALFPLLDALCPPGAARERRAAPGTVLRAHAGAYAALAVVALLYLALRLAVLGELSSGRTPGFVDNPIAHVSTPLRVANAAVVAVRALGLFLFPVELSHDYSYAALHVVERWSDPVLLASAAVLALLALGVAFAWRRSRGIVAGLAFTAVTYSVTSNVVVPITAMMAERHLYVPALGLCLAGAAALRDGARALLPAGRERAAFAAVLGLLVALLGARTVIRNPAWESNATLRLRDVETRPRSAKLQVNAGYSLLVRDEPDRALEHFDTAIRIVEEPTRWAEPWRGRIWALLALGRRAEARAVYKEVWPQLDDPYIAPALEGRVELPFGREAGARPRP